MAERGIVGALPWTAAFVLAMVSAVRALRVRHRPTVRGLAFGAAMGLLAFAIHGLVDFNAQIPANGATAWVLMAIAMATLGLPARTSRRHHPLPLE